MTTSFFGGDPNVSHFTVNVRYVMPDEDYRTGNPEARRLAPTRRREQSEILKDLGFKVPYFQYKNSDQEAKSAAKEKAETFKKGWELKASFELEVAEGCFL